MTLSTIVRSLLCATLAVAGIAHAAPSTTTTSATAFERATARHLALEEAGRRSNDLRLRVLFSQRESRAPDGSPFEDVIPLSSLIESARGSSDPLVLELLLDRCRGPGDASSNPCDAVDLAQRWVTADTQNAIAWIELSAVLASAGDRMGADDAFVHAGRASTFREPTRAIAQAIFAKLPDSDDPRARYLNLSYALGRAAAIPMSWMVDTRDACRRETNHLACAHIADIAFRDADTIFGLQFARMLTAQAHEAEWVHRSRQQTEEALLWAQAEFGLAFEADQAMALDEAALVKINRVLEKVVAKGDAAAARDALREQHLSDAEGSAHYAAYMAKMMHQLHPW
jgi:hypothetical protein